MGNFMDPKTARQLVDALTFIRLYSSQRIKRCTSFVRAKLLLEGELEKYEAGWEQPLTAQERKTVEACVPVLKKAQRSCDTAIRFLSSEPLPKGFDADALLEAIRKIQPNGHDNVGAYEKVKRTFVAALDILSKHAEVEPSVTTNVSSLAKTSKKLQSKLQRVSEAQHDGDALPKIILDQRRIRFGKWSLNEMITPEMEEFLIKLAIRQREGDTCPLPYTETESSGGRDEQVRDWKVIREKFGAMVGADIAKSFVRVVKGQGYRLQPEVQVVEHGRTLNINPEDVHSGKQDRSGRVRRQRKRLQD